MRLPTDNEFGIPSLPIEADARHIPEPVIGWGTFAQSRQMAGTYHCYVSDHKFGALLRSPQQILASGCSVACEPNITVTDSTPRWEALAAVGRKRTVSAQWVAHGIGLFVDLCMPEFYLDIALLGVPRGWRSYSTRGFAERVDEVEREYRAAMEHSQGRPLFLVVGGGLLVAGLCLTLPGAVHVPSERGFEKSRNQHQGRGTEAAVTRQQEGVTECQKAQG